MEFIMPFLSSIAEHVIESVIIRFSKPRNVKARLSTIEAYCVYYPIYLSLARLGKESLNKEPNKPNKGSLGLVKRFMKSLEKDPVLIVRVIHKISSVGPSKPLADTTARERFRRSADLLYLPEPYYNDLVADVRDDVAKIFGMVSKEDKESVEDALKYAEEAFKKRYSQGDIQIPEAEEIVEETLILIYTALKFKETLGPFMIKPLVDYYSVLTLERSLGEAPLIIATIISAFAPPEAALQILQKLRGRIPPLLAEELNRISTEIGFSYEDFKKAFIEIEQKLRH
jgi:hypothetical protein